MVELTYPNLTHIVVSDEVVELGSALDDSSFDVAEWSGVLATTSLRTSTQSSTIRT